MRSDGFRVNYMKNVCVKENIVCRNEIKYVDRRLYTINGKITCRRESSTVK